MQTCSCTFSALLLDFDGVIVESTDIKTRAFAEMFGEYPEHLGAIINYHRQHVGVSRYKKFAWIYQELLRQPITEALLKSLGARFSETVFEKIIRAPFVPGALETLASCASTGVPVFIISGTPHEELLRILELRGLQELVTQAWGTPTEKTDAIRFIQSHYGIETTEMLFVGDGMVDYTAATSEGVAFLARDSGGEDVDWSSLGVVSVPDLTCLAALQPDRPATIQSAAPNVPPITLTLKGVTTRAST